MGDVCSTCLDVACSVPRGQCWALNYLFGIFMIFVVCKVLKLVLFADDTNILCAHESFNELLGVVTQEIRKLKNWFDRNQLSPNLSKTKFMLFGIGTSFDHVQVHIEGVEIERV